MMNNELPTVLLLPGLLCDEHLWQHQIKHLADICQPRVADLTRDSSIAEMAKRLLTTAPKRFILVGLSMGGYVALEIMRVAPERVICLALIDTMACLDEPDRVIQRKGLIKLTETGRFLGVTPRLLPNLIHQNKLKTPIADEVMAMAQRLGKEVFIRQQTAILNRVDSMPMLNKITVPTLIIVGEDDKVTPPSESFAMAKAIPSAKLHILSDCGHLAPLELPEATTTLLKEWLTQYIN